MSYGVTPASSTTTTSYSSLGGEPSTGRGGPAERRRSAEVSGVDSMGSRPLSGPATPIPSWQIDQVQDVLRPADPRKGQTVGRDPTQTQNQGSEVYGALRDESAARGVKPAQLGHRAMERMVNSVGDPELKYHANQGGYSTITRGDKTIFKNVHPDLDVNGGNVADWSIRLRDATNDVLKSYNRTYVPGIPDPTARGLTDSTLQGIREPYVAVRQPVG